MGNAPLWVSVIGTALGLGVVHVMTGPDHLSALSTLSVGKPLKTAFGLGVRWGCGHSFGLLIVAIIFFAVGQHVNLSVLSYWADLFVGIFMVLLGVWYILKAFRERQKYLQKKEEQEVVDLLQKQSHNVVNNDNDNDHNNHNDGYDMSPINVDIGNDDIDIDNDNINMPEEQIELQQIPDNNSSDDPDNEPSLDKDLQMEEVEHDDIECSSNNDHPFNCYTINSEQHQLKSYQNGLRIEQRENEKENERDDDIIPDDDMIMDPNDSLNPLFDPKEDSKRTKCITRVAAFVAGIFHGVAGPGGVLGVMVALKLNDWFLSSLYLLLFFVSSIVTMGLYAITYGYTTQRMTVCANNKQKCAFILKFVSAIFSLVVGVLWLSLTFTGTLDDLFS